MKARKAEVAKYYKVPISSICGPPRHILTLAVKTGVDFI